jgi:hypothetical protein
MATVGLLRKPPDVNPKFQLLKKDELTKYKVLQLEAETRQKITAYLTQEEIKGTCAPDGCKH